MEPVSLTDNTAHLMKQRSNQRIHTDVKPENPPRQTYLTAKVILNSTNVISETNRESENSANIKPENPVQIHFSKEHNVTRSTKLILKDRIQAKQIWIINTRHRHTVKETPSWEP